MEGSSQLHFQVKLAGCPTKEGKKDSPNVSQSPTSVRQLPTRCTLLSGISAMRGYHLPTKSTYSSTQSGLTSCVTIECMYLPRAKTALKLASICASISRPSFVP